MIGASDDLEETWSAGWETALAAWSSFTKLRPPIFCFTKEQERAEGLTGSFAMIRLRDHSIVISLRQVAELQLDDFAVEVLAHEIGHHVFVPADLRDHARVLARIRAALGPPMAKRYGPMVANLWADLLINDRLQRNAGLDLASVYRRLEDRDKYNASPLWTLYLRTYEHLWSLPRGDLAYAEFIPPIEGDARLAARLVRSFAREWIDGSGRFATLLLPYLVEEESQNTRSSLSSPWLDSLAAGEGGDVPDGLATMEEGEVSGVGHPALDPGLFGDHMEGDGVDGEGNVRADGQVPSVTSTGRATIGGGKNLYRPPEEFRQLMQSLGVQVSAEDLLIRYYRELARPFLIRFPVRELPSATDPVPAGVEIWEPGHPIAAIDWVATATASPVIIPGVTTVQRIHDESPGSDPELEPPDLYLGVDCSGSMGNPAAALSYPVLAGAVITLSALRAGARVKTCLSGEPGRFSETQEFSRDANDNLRILTSYLGTGYAFGLQRLVDEFLVKPRPARPVHLLIVTDYDLMSMLAEGFELHGEKIGGWEVAAQALERAGGGGTALIQGSEHPSYQDQVERLRAIGWAVHFVRTQDELVEFARAFSRARYEPHRGRR